ncbi:hypothetical protein MPNT_340015 [Candidatus Methylacidithermus pantelleriae]|uniref:Uncharacterized protein n=1 Tax=Candidatus Methylacidithermus pantelleriae TaxID=2744239 RepID=A0A8J2FSQ6_9BACT|nr:hypothetical protein MPNT_340015 [Candidatus Methylacidithermus pantelleriae]
MGSHPPGVWKLPTRRGCLVERLKLAGEGLVSAHQPVGQEGYSRSAAIESAVLKDGVVACWLGPLGCWKARFSQPCGIRSV